MPQRKQSKFADWLSLVPSGNRYRRLEHVRLEGFVFPQEESSGKLSDSRRDPGGRIVTIGREALNNAVNQFPAV